MLLHSFHQLPKLNYAIWLKVNLEICLHIVFDIFEEIFFGGNLKRKKQKEFFDFIYKTVSNKEMLVSSLSK